MIEAKPFADGIYYFMPAETYHGDPALGSSDLRAILKAPRRYWLASWMNPTREFYKRPDTEATVVGTGIHDYLLEGAAKFTDRFVRRPDDPPGASPADKSTVTKAAKKGLMPYQTLLHGDDWNLIMDASRTITSHPDLREVFEGGDHEVSVFWTNELGIRCKARYDILKPGGIGDIKSVANQYGDRFEIACKWAIKRFRYDIQAEHYLEGRRHLPQLFKREKVFVFTGRETKPLDEMTGSMALIRDRLMEVAKVKRFAFQFIFISKEMPESWACTVTPGSPILEKARDDIIKAFELFGDQISSYGMEPWPETWRMKELLVDDMPGGEWGWN